MFSKKFISLLAIVCLGIGIRLVFAFSFNHIFDYFNILVLSKSAADTNSLLEGFFVIKNGIQHSTQLFGKIYYQIVALWLYILDFLKLTDLRYIFDIKRYDPHTPYMAGFTHWGPLHYQLTLIKLIQFLYEGVFLFFFLSIIRLIKNNSFKAVLIGTLFWAINPFLIYPAYVPFQSDLAMTTFLIGGVYFAIRSYAEKKPSITSKNLIFMSLCFAIGALMKQVPILFILPFLIILTRKLSAFLANSGIFFLFYVLISQPFAQDSVLMKTFFLTSEESTALFNFSLNSASVAVVGYVIILLLIIVKRKIIRQSPIYLLQISLILLSFIYISEDISYLYAQFNLWIMPFIMILAFINPLYSLFLLVPIFGFYRWIIIDNGAMTGSMWVTYGAALDRTPPFDSILSNFLQPKLIHRMINSLFLVGHGLIIFYSIKNWGVRNKTQIPISLAYIPLILLSLYGAFFIFDFSYRSHLSLVTNIKHYDLHDEKLIKNPVRIIVDNPNNRTITGIQISIMQKNIHKNDYVVVETFDHKGNRLSRSETNDFTLPNGFSDFIIPFGKGVNNKQIIIKIGKKYGQNEVYIQSSDTMKFESSVERDYGAYDAFYDTEPVKMRFPGLQYKVNITGQYTFNDMFMNVANHYLYRPKFYVLFIATTITLLLFGSLSTIYIFYSKKIQI